MISRTYKNPFLTVGIYSVSHFIVDFACAFLMFRYIAGTSDALICLLLYNFFAFAVQMPVGLLADKINRNFLFAFVGLLLVAAAYGFPNAAVLAAAALGLGNGMFHIGGGIDVLNISDTKSSYLGVFVSPGAMGVYLGTMLGRGEGPYEILLVLALAAAALAILVMQRSRGSYHSQNAELSLKGAGTKRVLIAAACLFLVVCLRSYTGLSLAFPWKSIGAWGAILICAVVLGKTLGGFSSDRFGAEKTTVFSLGTAALLFLFSGAPVPGIAAVLLFNFTMPITLRAMANIFPGAKGFSFGLLTFSLFLGYLPAYMRISPPPEAYWVFTAAAVLSLALLLAGLKRAKA